MITKPFKDFIGKDTARNANITGNEILSLLMTTTDTDALGDGEIIVLDKAFNVLLPGATVADSDRIYIAIGTTKTFTLSPESGTAVTARKIKISDPIISGYVRNFSGKAYAAKAEQEWDVTLTAPTAGRQYVLRCVYKDLYEHPGMFKQEWRYTATAADAAAVDTFGAAVAAVVNADPNTRVTATYTAGTDNFKLSAKAMPGCTTGCPVSSSSGARQMRLMSSIWLWRCWWAWPLRRWMCNARSLRVGCWWRLRCGWCWPVHRCGCRASAG